MDKRLPDFIRKVRKELPKTHIYINSNGDFMTLELWKKLREAGLNYINIAVKDDNYNDNLKETRGALGWRERQSFGLRVSEI